MINFNVDCPLPPCTLSNLAPPWVTSQNSPNDDRDNRVLNLSAISMGHEIHRSVSKIWPEIYIIVLTVVSVQQFNMMGFLG